MNPLQANLSALRQTHPALAERLERLHPPEARYRIQSTQTAPSLEVLHQERWIPWHSRYDPIKEAQRDLLSLDTSTVFTPLLLGLGLGYPLRLLWDTWRDALYDIIVVEQDPFIFRLALEQTRLDDVFLHPRLHLHVGEDLSAWQVLCRKIMPGVMSSRLEVMIHSASGKTHSRFYQTAMETLKHQMHTTSAEFDFTIRNGTAIQENLWRNLPAIVNSIGVHQIHRAWRAKPAVVAAAGPSLDKNIHHLRGMEDRVLILTVDTALRTLNQHGITPHIVVTTDPTELNLKHFESTLQPAQTLLAFDPEVYYRIPEQWRHRTLFLNLEKNEYTRWIERTAGPFGYLPKGGSVGNTAFYLARIVGADPVILVGLDLAFDPQGGKTHTGASVLARECEAPVIGSSSAVLAPSGGFPEKREHIVWVEGTHYDLVPTSAIMQIYIRQFNAEITKTAATVIDATEGGARLAGSVILPLRDALQQHALVGGAQSWVAAIQPLARDREAFQQEIASILLQLKESYQHAGEGIQLCEEIKPLLHLGERLRHHPSWLKMDDCFQKIYHAEGVKIALEQALFGAVFHFIRKEKPHEVEARRQKYLHYFQTVRDTIPPFTDLIQSLSIQ